MDEKFTLFAEYVKHFKEEFDYIKDMFSDDVQEAYKIMIQVGDIIADPSNSDQSLRKAIFEKVPREKIKWAVEVISNWKTEGEQKAEDRDKERERRQKRGGMEERKMTEKKNQELYENFDTTRILYAVDVLDEVRPVISDQFNEDGFPRPPEIRDKLLKLHEKAHEIINGEFRHDTDMGMFDLAWELEEELYDVIRNLEQIKKVIDDLTDLTPSEEDEDAD
ncbi:MAG: hypothetical protein GY909_06675 [Oligoflexia bacterium]|nr:hypothetical protein [Oligoflexia bacterium]